MARYIDVDALIERLGINQDCTECSYCTRKCYCSWNPDPGEICIAISEQPSVTINDIAEEIKVTNCNYNHFADVSKKDLISRRDILALIQSYQTLYRREIKIDDIYDAVLHLPSAQPEIIRCKDCIHKYDHDCPIDWDKTDSDFCSFAERRTDE